MQIVVLFEYLLLGISFPVEEFVAVFFGRLGLELLGFGLGFGLDFYSR